MSAAFHRRRLSTIIKIMIAAVLLVATVFVMLIAMLFARAFHPAAGSCPSATAQWKLDAITRHIAQSNHRDFNDGKDVELTGNDQWQESDGTWNVNFTTGHGRHRFVAIITCDGVTELSGR
jgi:hypothetical protein